MPRRTPIRKRSRPAFPSDSPSARRSSREEWVSACKEKAISMLPPMAPLETKVRLREQVERILTGHSPSDPPAEIGDILTMLTQPATAALVQQEAAQRLHTRKQHLLQMGETYLNLLINLGPPHLVGTPNSPRRIQVQDALRGNLRRVLTSDLSGAESDADFLRRVREFFSEWQLKLESDATGRSTKRSLWPLMLAGATAAGFVAARHPAVREAIGKGARALGDLLNDSSQTNPIQAKPAERPPQIIRRRYRRPIGKPKIDPENRGPQHPECDRGGTGGELQ